MQLTQHQVLAESRNHYHVVKWRVAVLIGAQNTLVRMLGSQTMLRIVTVHGYKLTTFGLKTDGGSTFKQLSVVGRVVSPVKRGKQSDGVFAQVSISTNTYYPTHTLNNN